MEIFLIRLKSVRNSNIFLVSSENGDNLFHSDAIVKYGIVGGQNDDEKFYKALEESEILIGLELANKYISSTIKTEKQLRDYLYKKEFKKQIIDAVVEKLNEYGILDDSAFAQMYVNSNLKFSKNKLKQKLYQFGVNNEIVDHVLFEYDDFDGCFKNAEKFLKNKDCDKSTFEKLVRRLLGQGYNYETVKKVLNKLKFDTDEE